MGGSHNIMIFNSSEDEQQSFKKWCAADALFWSDNCDHGLALLAETEIHILVADLDNNPVDSKQLIKFVREKKENLPIIVYSENSTAEAIIEAMNWGVNDYVIKPFDEEKFNRSLRLTKNLFEVKKGILQSQLDRFQESKLNDLEMMATGIAHEINNPLAIILGHAMRIKRLAKGEVIDQKGILDHVGDIETTLVRINKIVTGLRTFNSDSLKENFVKTTISDIVKNTEMFFIEQVQQKNIKYSYHPPENDIEFKCLNVQLSQAILNLVTNAIHAIEDTSEPWIKVLVQASDETLEVSVVNSGSKIPEDVAAHLFDPFYTTKDPDKGTGLGLSITKSIVEKHNGIIEHDDTSDNTRFNIYLPLEN